jgi:hypothetical protein
LTFEGSAAEAVYGGKDVVGGLGPSEGFGLGVVGVDVGFERVGRSMDATADFLFGEQREEALPQPRWWNARPWRCATTCGGSRRSKRQGRPYSVVREG